MQLIIGITGRAQSGKSTIAEAIQEACVDRFDCKTYELSSYVLKEAQNRRIITSTVSRQQLSPAEIDILVDYGLKQRRLDEFYWLDIMSQDIQRDRPQIAIIPNIRFCNEAGYVRNGLMYLGYGGVIIRSKTFIFDGVEYISRDRDPNSMMEIEQERIEADYFVTVKRGNPYISKKIARTIFEHIVER